MAPAFGPGRNPGDPGSNPTSGSRCMEPASPSACVSASLSLSLSLCDYHKKKKTKKTKKKKQEIERKISVLWEGLEDKPGTSRYIVGAQ